MEIKPNIFHFVRLLCTLLGCGLLFGGLTGGKGCTGKDQNVCSECHSELPSEKVIIVLVDGLRFSRLKEGGNFKKCRRLLDEGKGHLSVSIAQPPTVTLPKIKTIVSGRASVYSDVLFNFFGESASAPSLLTEAISHNLSIVVNGDDTWHRTFNIKGDPVSSFNVTDYSEVDNNVTRHITELTEMDEWSHPDIVVLHYLGIDHIGHYLGSDNEEMTKKEQEMDSIIYDLATSLNTKKTAIWVLSDHGMTSAGNHGGASDSEIEAVAMMLSHKKSAVTSMYSAYPSRNTVSTQQIDIAATIALQLKLPIPRCNNGVLWPVVFTPESLQYCMSCNQEQLRSCLDTVIEVNITNDLNEMFMTLSSLSDDLTVSIISTNPVVVLVGFLLLIAVIYSLAPAKSLILTSIAMSLPIWSSAYAEEIHHFYNYLALSVLVYSCFKKKFNKIGIIALRIGTMWECSGIYKSENPNFDISLSSLIKGHPILSVSASFFLFKLILQVSDNRNLGFFIVVAVVSALFYSWTFFFKLLLPIHVVFTSYGIALSRITASDSTSLVITVQLIVVSIMFMWYNSITRWVTIATGGIVSLIILFDSSNFIVKTPPQQTNTSIPTIKGMLHFSIFTTLLGVVSISDIPVLGISFILGEYLRDADHYIAAICSLATLSFTGTSISIASFNLSSAYELVNGFDPIVLPILILSSRYSGLLCCSLSRFQASKSFSRMLFVFFLIRVLVSAVVVMYMNQVGHLFVWSVFTPVLMFSCLDAMIVAIMCLCS